MDKLKCAVFLDRDGVINVAPPCGDDDASHYILGWDQFEFLPGAMDAMCELYCMDYAVFVVSNQGGISKGLTYKGEAVTSPSIYKIFYRMHFEIMKHITTKMIPSRLGIIIQDVKICPHLPEHNCACRKPKPGMIYSLAIKWNIDLSKSWMIGDQESDISAGWNARIRRVIKIRAGTDSYEQGTYRGLRSWRTKSTLPILPSLLNAVQFIQDVDKWEEEHER